MTTPAILPDEMKCPACAEIVKREAKKCKHCGSAIISAEVKKTASRVALTIVTSFFLLCFFIGGSCIYAISRPDNSAAGVTHTQWMDHRDRLNSYAKQIANEKTYTGIYSRAMQIKGEITVDNCKLPGCSEFRQYLRELSEVAADGNLTPQEIHSTGQTRAYFESALADGAKKVNR